MQNRVRLCDRYHAIVLDDDEKRERPTQVQHPERECLARVRSSIVSQVCVTDPVALLELLPWRTLTIGAQQLKLIDGKCRIDGLNLDESGVTNEGDVSSIQETRQCTDVASVRVLIGAERVPIGSLTKITNTRRIVTRRIELSVQSIGSTDRSEQQGHRLHMIVTIDDVQTTIT